MKFLNRESQVLGVRGQRSAVKRVTRDAELLDRRDDQRPPPHLQLLLKLVLLRQVVAAAVVAVDMAPIARLFLRAS